MSVEIKKTNKYSKFKRQTGNRELSQSNLISLEKKVIEKNMLCYNPILVNSDYEVIDGQHRLEVAKRNGFEISFIVVPHLGLKETMGINTTGSKWTNVDFLKSYVDQEVPQYLVFKDFMDDYNFLSLSQCLFLLTGKTECKPFKEGNLLIKNQILQ